MTCSDDGTVRIWDTASIEQKTVVKPTLSKPGRMSVTACAYGADGRLIGSGLRDGSIQLWNVSGECFWGGRFGGGGCWWDMGAERAVPTGHGAVGAGRVCGARALRALHTVCTWPFAPDKEPLCAACDAAGRFGTSAAVGQVAAPKEQMLGKQVGAPARLPLPSCHSACRRPCPSCLLPNTPCPLAPCCARPGPMCHAPTKSCGMPTSRGLRSPAWRSHGTARHSSRAAWTPRSSCGTCASGCGGVAGMAAAVCCWGLLCEPLPHSLWHAMAVKARAGGHPASRCAAPARAGSPRPCTRGTTCPARTQPQSASSARTSR